MTIGGNERCSFRMTLTACKRTYSFQGPTEEIRGRETVCICTLANSSGASEAYPGWNLLVCSPFILRIQKARLLTLITENLIFLHRVFAKQLIGSHCLERQTPPGLCHKSVIHSLEIRSIHNDSTCKVTPYFFLNVLISLYTYR